MNRLIALLALATLGAAPALAPALAPAPAMAQEAPPAPQAVTANGQSIYIGRNTPEAMYGTYLYERQGQPTIELRPDGTGHFQPHGVPPIPIRFFVQTDGTGEPYIQRGQVDASYQHILVVQFGPGGGGNYPQGSFDRFNWIWDASTGCAIILGERFKC